MTAVIYKFYQLLLHLQLWGFFRNVGICMFCTPDFWVVKFENNILGKLHQPL
jgi:hypothetical protein